MEVALGPLCLTHSQFWELTPKELNQLADGYLQREENDMQKLAWQTAHIMNLFSKRKVKIEDLLKKSKAKVNRNQTTPEETGQILDELDALLGEPGTA